MKLTAKQERFAQCIADGVTQADAYRWYVYELIDPRDGMVFYVGKGAGQRMHHHERDADRGVCSKKTFKIKDIKAYGFEIQKRQVAFFWDEQAAYDFETDLIEDYGLKNLTNILPGGQKAWEFRLTERQKRQSEISPVGYAKLVKQTDNLSWWFVRYVVAVENGCRQIEVTGTKVQAMIGQACFNVFYPKAWAAIKSSIEAMRIVEPVFEKHGVKVQYGCA